MLLRNHSCTFPSHLHFTPCSTRCASEEWVVYSKPPFGGTEHVLKYPARYTHRVAIANGRLLSLDGDQILSQARP